MELISKISKGSKMDQIYISKNRQGFSIGEYVLITPITQSQKTVKTKKPYFYGIKNLEPIKINVISEVFSIIEKKANFDNIIISGSFLDKGFCFNDLDILIVTNSKIDISNIEKSIKDLIGIKLHLIVIDNKSLIEGLSTDPLYQSMLSKCVSIKRLVYNIKPKINYKILDLHLLKSKILQDNFDSLSGSEKYYYTQNMIGIYLFLKFKKVTKEMIDNKIKELFGVSKEEIKNNLMEEKEFLKKFKEIYNEAFDLIMEGIKNESK
jgi:galactitol-specific phosphotransferase system IIB component